MGRGVSARDALRRPLAAGGSGGAGCSQTLGLPRNASSAGVGPGKPVTELGVNVNVSTDRGSSIRTKGDAASNPASPISEMAVARPAAPAVRPDEPMSVSAAARRSERGPGVLASNNGGAAEPGVGDATGQLAGGPGPDASVGPLIREAVEPDSPVNIRVSRALPPPLRAGSDAAAPAAKLGPGASLEVSGPTAVCAARPGEGLEMPGHSPALGGPSRTPAQSTAVAPTAPPSLAGGPPGVGRAPAAAAPADAPATAASGAAADAAASRVATAAAAASCLTFSSWARNTREIKRFL